MRLIHKILLLSCVFFSTTPQNHNITSENTVIACDIDQVVLDMSLSHYLKIAYNTIKLIQSPHDIIEIPKTLWHIKTDIGKIYDENGKKVEGLTPRLLHIGMNHKKSARHISNILEVIESSHYIINDTVKVLQATNLPIIWTTNKDSLSYKEAVKKYALDTIAPTAIVTKQVLSQKIIDFCQQPDTPESYRALVEKYTNDHETINVFHAPGRKPEIDYYRYVERIIGPEKNIIHIDDKKENIEGFDKLKEGALAQRIGILFKNPARLEQELIKLGILSSTIDEQQIPQTT